MLDWLQSLTRWVDTGQADLVFIGTLLIGIISFYLLRWIDKTHRNSLQMRILRRSIKPIVSIILIIGSKLSLKALEVEKKDYVERFLAGVDHALTIALIFAISWLFIASLGGVRAHILRRFSLEAADNLRARKVHTQINVFYRLCAVIVILISLGLSLMTFDGVDNIGTSLLASAGITGIVLGFAAQKTLTTIVAGIQIAITQPIRLEDAVVVEGEWGWIEEITLTYVVIRIWDLRRLVVPITYFIESPFQNWTRTTAEIIGSVEFYVDYNVPLEAMRAEFERILSETPLWNGNVQVLQVTDATEKSQKIRLLMTGKDSPTTWDLRCEVREKLISWLQKNYPSSLPQTRINLHDIVTVAGSKLQ